MGSGKNIFRLIALSLNAIKKAILGIEGRFSFYLGNYLGNIPDQFGRSVHTRYHECDFALLQL